MKKIHQLKNRKNDPDGKTIAEWTENPNAMEWMERELMWGGTHKKHDRRTTKKLKNHRKVWNFPGPSWGETELLSVDKGAALSTDSMAVNKGIVADVMGGKDGPEPIKPLTLEEYKALIKKSDF